MAPANNVVAVGGGESPGHVANKSYSTRARKYRLQHYHTMWKLIMGAAI